MGVSEHQTPSLSVFYAHPLPIIERKKKSYSQERDLRVYKEADKNQAFSREEKEELERWLSG